MHTNSVILDIKPRFTSGELNLYWNTLNCQNIGTRLIGVCHHDNETTFHDVRLTNIFWPIQWNTSLCHLQYKLCYGYFYLFAKTSTQENNFFWLSAKRNHYEFLFYFQFLCCTLIWIFSRSKAHSRINYLCKGALR